MDTIKNAVQSVISAISTQEPSVSRAEVIALEEQERHRRTDLASQAHVAQLNAKALSKILTDAQFPAPRGSNGYKKYINKSAEQERKRRLDNRTEYALRKLNAARMSGLIRSLGWPFYRSSTREGAVYIFPDETLQLEEVERKYRLNNPMLSKTAKDNAANVAGLMSWAHFKANPVSGTKRYTRMLEERERKRRISNPAGLEKMCEHSYAEARCIRNLGYPHFVQGKESLRAVAAETSAQEEKERARRLKDRSEQKIAQQQAGVVSSLVANADAYILEDKEQERRLRDFQGQQLAKENATRVASMVQSTKPANLADMEQKRRMNSAEDQAVARRNAQLVSRMIATRNNKSHATRTHVEAERARILSNPLQQLQSRQIANQVAGLVSQAGFQKSPLRGLALQQTRSANLVSNTRHLTNAERDRRVADLIHQQTAKENALKVSNLLRSAYQENRCKSLSSFDIELGLPVGGLPESFGISAMDSPVTRAIPTASKPLPQIPTASLPVTTLPALPALPKTATFSPVATASPVAISPATTVSPVATTFPTTTLPANTTPTPTTYQQAPLSSAKSFFSALPTKSRNLINKTQAQLRGNKATPAPPASFPATVPTTYSAPAHYVPPATSRTSVPSDPLPSSYTTPVSAAPSTSSYITPASYAAPASASYAAPTSTYVPVDVPASYSSPVISYATPTSAPVVPPVPRGLSTVHSDRERKLLTKEAAKHAKLATKESRKADQAAHKAELLFSKGKDSRASKHEASAEQHALAAKHHQQWAQDAQLLAGSSVDPALVTSSGKSTM